MTKITMTDEEPSTWPCALDSNDEIECFRGPGGRPHLCINRMCDAIADVVLMPAHARELAARLIAIADEIEGEK